LDTTLATWIIGGMAFGYVGMAGYVVKLHSDITKMNLERLKSAEDKLALIQLLNENGGNTNSGIGGKS
jgi:hypothetical protein